MARIALTAALVAANLSITERRGQAASEDEARTRGEWAVLLVGYAALSALTVGGAYVMRDNFIGRGVAVSAATAGGLMVGAGAGFGLGRLRSCQTAECWADDDVPTLVGGLVGGTAAAVVATILTFGSGVSRPGMAAAGMAPGLLFVSMGTIACW